jgi:hypothetical protein
VRRTTLIAACAFGLAMAVGLVALRRDAARTLLLEQHTKPLSEEPGIPHGTAKAEQIAVPAPGTDPTAAKPVIIGRVTPWIEIARRPPYVRSSAAERRAIRDLYWNICVEDRIPVAQRESAYWQFVRDSENAGPGESADPTRAPTLSQYLQQQQAGVPSPVDPGTMRDWCKR